MTTCNVGIRQGNTVIPYAATTKTTKWIAVTNAAHITMAGNGITTSTITEAYIRATADSNGKWFFEFDLYLTRASGSGARDSVTVTFASPYAVTFTNAFYPIVVTALTNYVMCTGRTSASASTLYFAHANSDEGAYTISGIAPLASEPTWAAANMEGVIAADVYIAPASAGTAGLVNNVAGNTVGTPILGRTDGGTVGAGYVGEEKTAYAATSITQGDYRQVTSLTLTEGTWLVSAGLLPGVASGQTSSETKLTVKGAGGTTLGDDNLYAFIGGQWCSSVTFTSRIVNIASGDVDKTVKVFVLPRGADTLAYGKIQAVRIA